MEIIWLVSETMAQSKGDNECTIEIAAIAMTQFKMQVWNVTSSNYV